MSSTAPQNPYDTEATAAAITRALDMSLEERKERWTAMMDRLQRMEWSIGAGISSPSFRRAFRIRAFADLRRGRPVFGTGIAHVPG